MREEPAFLLLPPFIAESGHTQAARLTTNCQTDISSVWCTCSLLLWALFLLFFAQFGFQHIFSLITYQVSFHLASWWPHLFHFSFHLSFSRLLKMQLFPNNSCVLWSSPSNPRDAGVQCFFFYSVALEEKANVSSLNSTDVQYVTYNLFSPRIKTRIAPSD